MTREEAITLIDELLVCIKEHPIIADWLVEIENRKTENSSEIPNNCEHITEDGVTCAKYPACDDCPDNPLNKVKGSERFVKGSEQTDCQTCKWWSSYGYCVHRECKGYEPQTCSFSDCDNFKNPDYERCIECKRKQIKLKTEPQTRTDEDGRVWEYRNGNWWALGKTENSSEKPNNCEDCRNWNHNYGACTEIECNYEPNNFDKDINVRSKDCETCKHYKLACELFSEICKYEPTTQTETQNSNLNFEKRTMRDCYNCKRYEAEGECIECHYEPTDEPQTNASQHVQHVESVKDETGRWVRVGQWEWEHHTDTTHFGKVKGESITTNKVEDEPQTDGILFKGNLKEGDYKLIKTTNGWVLEGNDIAYYGEPQTERSNDAD